MKWYYQVLGGHTLETPILMTGPNVRAILADQKSEARRIARLPKSYRYGLKGDLLWVRETWRKDKKLGIVYRASNPDSDLKDIKWKAAIHMRKADCRLWLRIVDVRIELLHAITDEDAKAEGVRETSTGWIAPGMTISMRTPVLAYMALWNTINTGMDAWAFNPRVWVIRFERESEHDY